MPYTGALLAMRPFGPSKRHLRLRSSSLGSAYPAPLKNCPAASPARNTQLRVDEAFGCITKGFGASKKSILETRCTRAFIHETDKQVGHGRKDHRASLPDPLFLPLPARERLSLAEASESGHLKPRPHQSRAFLGGTSQDKGFSECRPSACLSSSSAKAYLTRGVSSAETYAAACISHSLCRVVSSSPADKRDHARAARGSTQQPTCPTVPAPPAVRRRMYQRSCTVTHQNSSDGNALLLTSRQLTGKSFNLRLVVLRELTHKAIRSCLLCCLDNFFVCYGGRGPQANVFSYLNGKEQDSAAGVEDLSSHAAAWGATDMRSVSYIVLECNSEP